MVTRDKRDFFSSILVEVKGTFYIQSSISEIRKHRKTTRLFIPTKTGQRAVIRCPTNEHKMIVCLWLRNAASLPGEGISQFYCNTNTNLTFKKIRVTFFILFLYTSTFLLQLRLFTVYYIHLTAIVFTSFYIKT